MDLEAIRDYFTMDHIRSLLQSYRDFGPLAGIFFPMLEAFLPFLPLFAFIMTNAAAYGLWAGFFYSWVGSCIGSLLLFMLIRAFGQHRFFTFVNRHPHIRKCMIWLERKGFGPIFLLFCLPFSPSALINVVAGLAKISKKQFILALMLGKMVMIFMVSYIGYDILSFIHKPLKTGIIICIVFLLWYVGKKLEVRLELGKK